jgi:hypothetical protein
MNRRTPLEQLRAMGADLHDSFALLPPVLLESVTSEIIHQGGYDVLARMKAEVKTHLHPALRNLFFDFGGPHLLVGDDSRGRRHSAVAPPSCRHVGLWT